MRAEYVDIHHPNGIESKVLRTSLNAWLRNGWLEGHAPVVVKKTDLSQVEESESKTDTTEAY